MAPRSYAQLTETTDVLGGPVYATDQGDGLFRILIGTFRFTAGLIAGQTTSLEAGDIPGSSDLITGGAAALDSLVTTRGGRASRSARRSRPCRNPPA